MSSKAPKGVRLVITLAGRRNAGKSSLINAITGQDIAIVSDTPGTTTDPVAKHYELLPLGPVTFYDTAGMDDVGELGDLRIKAAEKVLFRTDIALIAIGETGIGDHEKQLIDRVKSMEIAHLLVFNKIDSSPIRPADIDYCREHDLKYCTVSALKGTNINNLKETIINMVPRELAQDPVLVGDLINEGDWVVCVVPIDLAAPKGRLILPQVQVLREILDRDAIGITVKEREIEEVLRGMKQKPALVVTDSQVILKVSGEVPEDIPTTTFSTLFARYKGDLNTLVRGAEAIDELCDGDRILIGEACSHHTAADDIGRVKIPRWLSQYTGADLEFDVYSGHDFPEDLERYKLVIHCGSCMLGRAEMMRRIRECSRRKIPITNYGVAISKVQGVLSRVVAPFGSL